MMECFCKGRSALGTCFTWECGRWIHLRRKARIVIHLQYIPRIIYIVFILLCSVVVISSQFYPYHSGLLHWHWGNLMIAPVLMKQPWIIWVNKSHESIAWIFNHDKIFVTGCLQPTPKCHQNDMSIYKFVPKGPIDNNTAMIQIMAWRRIGDKPLSEPMLIGFTDTYMQHQGEMS